VLRIYTALIIGIFILGLNLSKANLHYEKVVFMDVGQGDAILIRTKQQKTILIDGGPNNRVLSKLGKYLPFWDRSIDLLILGHPDMDHVFGLVQVAKRYKVKNILITGVTHNTGVYSEFLRSVNLSADTKIWVNSADQDFVLDGWVVDVVYPFDSMFGQQAKSPNNTSISTKLRYRDFSVLLTGDNEVEVEEELIGNTDLNLSADVFKAGHHGSRTSNSKELLDLIDPEVVVIQSAYDNRFGHPHAESMETFNNLNAQLFRNDLMGDVVIRVVDN